MSAKRHLRELQWRLLIVAAFFVVGATVAYYFQDKIIPFLIAPLQGETLVYLNPAGGFSFMFLVAIYTGIAFCFPILLQQLYAFLRPALPKTAQRKSARLVILSFLLLIAGIAFGYFVAVPSALAFLYGFADQYIEASLTADSYLHFVIAYTIGLGIVFQLPLILMMIHKIRPLKPGGLMKSEKWIILGAFVVAAIITPTPDPINQAIIAGPIVIVYQIGVFAILFSIYHGYRQKHRALKVEFKTIRKEAKMKQKEPTQKPTFFQPAFAAEVEVEPTYFNAHESGKSLDGFAPRPIGQTTLTTPRSRRPAITQSIGVQGELARPYFPMDGVIVTKTPRLTSL